MKKLIIILIGLITISLTTEAKAPCEYVLYPSAKEELAIKDKEEIEEKTCKIEADLSILPTKQEIVFKEVIEIYGCEKIQSLKTLEIYDNEDLPRALAGASIVKLREDIFKKDEFKNILIHELAHVVDLGYFRGSPAKGESDFVDGSLPIFKGDLSLDFYKISWVNSEELREDANELDFVTGYAMTDPFEDFAESTLYYISHNREFRILTNNNKALEKKYNFIRLYVFEGKIFNTGNNFVDINNREWDATKI